MRENLDFGYHNSESKQKRLTYAINLIGITKELRPALSDSQIINKLSQNFTDEIRSAVIERGMNSLPIFLDLLEKFDQAGPLNYQRQRVDRNLTNTQRPKVNRTPNHEKKTVGSKFTSRKEESYPNKSQENRYKVRAITETGETETLEAVVANEEVEKSENEKASSLVNVQ